MLGTIRVSLGPIRIRTSRYLTGFFDQVGQLHPELKHLSVFDGGLGAEASVEPGIDIFLSVLKLSQDSSINQGPQFKIIYGNHQGPGLS